MAAVFRDGAETADARVLEDVSDLLHRVARRLRARANAELGPLGLTPAQARALRTMGRSGAPLRMSELADRLRIARRSATDVVEGLVGRGYVERAADPTDGRAIAVTVSAEGRAVLAALVAMRHRALADLASDLDAADLEALRRLLARLDTG
jgi:DNA-binding MarR family transcriptional regulator